jgi:chaperonin GroEL
LKEKRDRAEDAICAVRGAIKHGVLPGGGWTLLKLCQLMPRDEIIDEILRTAFQEPVVRLLSNVGICTAEELQLVLEPILLAMQTDCAPLVYDAILDSTPAVLEAIRNALSIATLLGTLGGTVVFGRDAELERSEAREEIKYNQGLTTADAWDGP